MHFISQMFIVFKLDFLNDIFYQQKLLKISTLQLYVHKNLTMCNFKECLNLIYE